MKKNVFENIPEPSVDSLPHSLKDLIVLHGKARLAKTLSIRELLRHNFLHTDNKYFSNRLNEIMKDSPRIMDHAISRATTSDFRQFIKEMISGEQINIVESLHNLHASGQEKEYQSAIQGWAKFGFGTEQKVDINVGIEQKRDLVKSINDEYAYSEALDTDFEMVEPLALPHNPVGTHTLEFQGDVPTLEAKINEPEPIKRNQISVADTLSNIQELPTLEDLSNDEEDN